MPDLLHLARKSTAARCSTLSRNAMRMSPDEVALLDSLLDEYARKTKAWRRQATAEARIPATEAGDLGD